MNYRRKRGIRNTTPADPHVLSELHNGKTASPAAVPFSTSSGAIHESQTEFDDEVINALGQLGDEARCCLLLRTVLGMSYAEISELMGIRQGTAMSHVHRGKSRMRKMLSSYMATGEQICEE